MLLLQLSSYLQSCLEWISKHFNFHLNFATKLSLLEKALQGAHLPVLHLDSLKAINWAAGGATQRRICSSDLRCHYPCCLVSWKTLFHTFCLFFFLFSGYFRQEGKSSPCHSILAGRRLVVTFFEVSLSFRLTYWAMYRNDMISEISFNRHLTSENVWGIKLVTVCTGWWVQ